MIQTKPNNLWIVHFLNSFFLFKLIFPFSDSILKRHKKLQSCFLILARIIHHYTAHNTIQCLSQCTRSKFLVFSLVNILITAVEAPFCEKILLIASEALDISINIYTELSLNWICQLICTELSLFATIMIPMALNWITKWNIIGVCFLCWNWSWALKVQNYPAIWRLSHWHSGKLQFFWLSNTS